MTFVAYPDADSDPTAFVTGLLERLSNIPGTSWRADPPPWHTTYDDWHVLGNIVVPNEASKDTTYAQSSAAQAAASGQGTKDGSHENTRMVAARVSRHSFRLERQFQLNKNLLDEYDPLGKRHIRALQLAKLPGRSPGEIPLTVIIMEHAGQ